MACFSDLPTEVHQMIISHLDGFSKMHLSNVCKYLRDMTMNDRSSKYSNFQNYYANNFSFAEIRKYLLSNKKHIEHLDLSYHSKWNNTLLVRTLIALPNLFHLNLILSPVTMSAISKLLEKHPKLTSIAFSYEESQEPLCLGNLKFIHLHFPRICMFSSPIINLPEIRMAEFKITVPKIQINFLTCFSEILQHVEFFDIEVASKSSSLDRLNFDRNYYKYYFAIETPIVLYVSDDVIHDFIQLNNLVEVVRLSTSEVSDIRKIFLAKRGSKFNYLRFKDKISKVIKEKSTTKISLNGPKFCTPAKFNAVQYFSLLDKVEYLEFQPCVLATKVPEQPPNREMFKARRVSRIPDNSKEDCVFHKIPTLTSNINTIHVGVFKHNCLCDKPEKEWELASNYLESICLFKNLKHLQIVNAPHMSTNVLKNIFESCVRLEILTLKFRPDYIINTLPSNISLCRHLKQLIVIGSMTNPINFLKTVPECIFLEKVEIWFKNIDRNLEEVPMKNMVLRVIRNCTRLSYFDIRVDYIDGVDRPMIRGRVARAVEGEKTNIRFCMM